MNAWHRSSDPFARREAKKYEHPIPSREFITDYLSQCKEPRSIEQLLKSFQLTMRSEKEALRRRLHAMIRDGQLVKFHSHYKTATQSDIVYGRVIGHRDGFGFVKPLEGTSQIFLPAYEMRQVFDGDQVAIRIVNIDYRGRPEGKVIKITERAVHTIVGHFFRKNDVGFVVSTNQRITQNIIIPIDAQGEAKHGQIVVAQITAYPTPQNATIAKITEILGDDLAPGLEIEIATRSYGLPHVWTKEVQDEIQQFSHDAHFQENTTRIDLCHLPFVTIDGEEAQDFDDALYCEPLTKGGWRLYVAIADVSHYVKQGTALDQEAYNRGNSVYFPGKVIPMLPEILSNNLCSLRPEVNRPCMICELIINASGQIQRYQFYTVIIQSHARLTYDHVFELLFKPTRAISKQEKTLRPHLQTLNRLYRALHHNRQQRGALDFETPEFRIEFGPDKKIKRLVSVDRHEVHKIVEECMLCANIAAAEFLTKHKAPSLYRIHDYPTATKLSDVRAFLREIGVSLKGGDIPSPAAYATVLKRIKTRPDAHLIQTVLLRSLSQAIYSPDNDGHFGLALKGYTHFTSPIRRYPDLLVHRAIHNILAKTTPTDLTPQKLKTLGEHCSITERRADEANYDVLNFLKCEYMQNKIGQKFKGIISGVTGFGFFVELHDLCIEGLVHIQSLANDHYLFEATRHRLIGKRLRKIYCLGDRVHVQVTRVSIDNKQIDFNLI